MVIQRTPMDDVRSRLVAKGVAPRTCAERKLRYAPIFFNVHVILLKFQSLYSLYQHLDGCAHFSSRHAGKRSWDLCVPYFVKGQT